MQQALEDGDPTNVQPSLVEGDVLASLTYEAPEEEHGIVVEEGLLEDESVEIEIDAVALEQELGQELEQQPSNPKRRERPSFTVEDLLAEEERETVRSAGVVAAACDRRCRCAAAATAARCSGSSRRPPAAPRRSSRKRMTAPTSIPRSQRSSPKKRPSCSRPPITSLSSWKHDRGNNALVFELKRVVHTLKGGARMAGIRAMGDLSHELETLMQLRRSRAGARRAGSVRRAAGEPRRAASHARCRQSRRALRAARELINRIRALGGQAPIAAPTPAAGAARPQPRRSPVAAAPVLD